MASDESCAVSGTDLSTIEFLVNEFYLPSTSNARKQVIESHLRKFQNTPYSWNLCLSNLQYFNNQYHWFFAVSTIELAITQKWQIIPEPQRCQIRDSLLSTFANYSTDIPGMQRDKLAQLIAQIAKRQFPEEYAEFMNHLTQLLEIKFNLGVALLRATSDEIYSTKSDVPSERQKHFMYCVSMYIPNTFRILHQYSRIFYKYITSKEAYNHCEIASKIPTLDESRIVQHTIDFLHCMQQLFTWIPLDSVEGEYLEQIFLLAHWNECYVDIGIFALQAISELFYRQKPLTQRTTIAKMIFDLLQQSTLKQSNDLYQEKLTDLIRLFMDKEWPRWCKEPDFPALELLELLFAYTFSSSGALSFAERLTIWQPIIRSFSDNNCSMINDESSPKSKKYVDQLLAVASGTVRRMLFQYDFDDRLENLDTDELDDNMESELQHFYNQCIDTLALISDIDHVRLYNFIFLEFTSGENSPFAQVYNVIVRMDSNYVASLNEDQNVLKTMTGKFKDFVALSQTITRISIMVLEKLSAEIASITPFVDGMLKLVERAAACSDPLEEYHQRVPLLFVEVVEVVAQVLITLKSLLHIKQIASMTDSKVYHFVSHLPKFLAPPQKASKEELKSLTSAAAQILLNVSANMRPKYLIELLKPLSTSNLSHLDRSTAQVIRKTICNCLMLSWNGGCTSMQEQNFQACSIVLQEYILFVAVDLIRLDIDHLRVTNDGQEQKIISVTNLVLVDLLDILSYYKEHNSTVKHILANAYQPVIEKTIIIYTAASGSSVGSTELIEQIFSFCLGVIQVLQVQLGQVFLKNIILLFLEKTKAEAITVKRFRAIDTLLKIFLLIVEQPGNTTLIPDIVNFSIDHVMPLLFADELVNKSEQNSHSDVCVSLYQLLHGVLLHRWQYFYKSGVLKQFIPITSSTSNATLLIQPQASLEHPEQFAAIMNCYGQAITFSSNMCATRTVLESLQIIGERWKLYDKEFFRQNLLQSFEISIIKKILSPEGYLHYDMFLTVLYGMGEVDKKLLHDTFLDIGIPIDLKHVKEVCLSTDYPTFVYHMNHLINDTKCNQLNSNF